MLIPQAKTENLVIDKYDALKTIYTHVHREMLDVRANMMRFGVVYSTFSLVATGWVFSNAAKLDRLGVTLLVCCFSAIAIFSYVFCVRIERQFNAYAKIINRAQTLLGGGTAGFFGQFSEREDNDVLFPHGMHGFGSPSWKEPLFSYNKAIVVLLYLIFNLSLLEGELSRYLPSFETVWRKITLPAS